MANPWRQPEYKANFGSLYRFVNSEAVLNSLVDPGPGPEERAERRQQEQYVGNFFQALIEMECQDEASLGTAKDPAQERWRLRVQVLNAQAEGKTPEVMAAELGKRQSTIYQVRKELEIIVPFLNEWLFSLQEDIPLPPHYRQVLHRLCRGQKRKDLTFPFRHLS